VSEDRLHRLLTRSAEAGRADAQQRAWPVAEQAFRSRPPAPSRVRRSPALALAIAAAALALIVAAGFTKPGSAVADWLRDRIAGRPGVKRAAPALTHLPGGGRLLIHSRAGIWVVNADGSRRLIGRYDGASWSPRGLYVAAWRGHELLAVEPGGRVHWSLARGGAITGARWAHDGFRVAYLSGASLRVVAGDGTGDQLIRRSVAPVVPEWRPHAPHLLAYSPGAGVVEVRATDLRARAWRARVRDRVRALTWSADGRLLAVTGSSSLWTLDGATGRVLERMPLAPGTRVAAVAFAPRGARVAVALNTTSGRARVMSVDARRRSAEPRLLFAGAGRFSNIAWSPDGRWVLIAWPSADQWLFVRSSKVTGVSAVRSIARQFDPRMRSPRFPDVGPWCCP
jgi:hypothetical protein